MGRHRKGISGLTGERRDALLALQGIRAYLERMIRFFDLADHDRLPWRFTALTRSVLARL